LHSAQGTMWEARNSPGSVIPVDGQRAAPVHQGFAENILADAPDDQPLGLGRPRQGGSLGSGRLAASGIGYA
jgi:hypothetical protein